MQSKCLFSILTRKSHCSFFRKWSYWLTINHCNSEKKYLPVNPSFSQFLAEDDHIDWPLAVITIQKTYFSVFTNIFQFSQYFLVFPVFDRKWSYWLTASSDCNPEEVFPNQWPSPTFDYSLQEKEKYLTFFANNQIWWLAEIIQWPLITRLQKTKWNNVFHAN